MLCGLFFLSLNGSKMSLKAFYAYKFTVFILQLLVP